MPKKIHPQGLEPRILAEVLKKYKKNPCLWDTAHHDYHNKPVKTAAWAKLLKIWRQCEPSATQYDIKTKIFHMRTNYTRHRRKVEAQLISSYKPTLWYYDHMNFLSGKKSEESENDSDSDSNDDETIYVNIPRGQKRQASESFDLEKQPETSTGTIEASAAAFGRSVGAQLHHLSKMQRCIAEKLISDVIYHAKLEHLTMTTSINMNVEDNNAKNIVIPETEPSWYDTVINNRSGQESSSSCTFITNEGGVKKEIDHETENAVNFIKVELDETPNDSHDLEFDERDYNIDIVKEELVEP